MWDARGATTGVCMRPADVKAAAVEPARERRDWTARARGTALDAIRYSQFVALMKRVLPLAAAVVLAAVLVYTFIPRQPERVTVSFERLGTIDNDLAMIKPHLSGSDAEGNPFVITADVAIQDPKNVHHVRLKKIEADTSLKDGRWMNATAAAGFFDMDTSLLKLTGGIEMFSDSGYELHTSKANIELKKGLFHGPETVTGHGPLGTLRADRFEIERLKRLIHLIGNVHMTLYPPKRHAP